MARLLGIYLLDPPGTHTSKTPLPVKVESGVALQELKNQVAKIWAYANLSDMVS